MDAALSYALNSFPVVVYVVETSSESEKFLHLSTDAWTVITGIAASVTAVVALMFSWWQARVARAHNMLMVHPNIDFKNVVSQSKGIYRLEVTNTGVGPAILKTAQIYVDDTPIDDKEDQVAGAVLALFPAILESQFGHETLGYGSYITVNQTVPLFTIHCHQSLSAQNICDIVDGRLYIVGTYASIYGELFTFDTRLIYQG